MIYLWQNNCCFLFRADLNYIYLSTMKDRLRTRKRIYREAVREWNSFQRFTAVFRLFFNGFWLQVWLIMRCVMSLRAWWFLMRIWGGPSCNRRRQGHCSRGRSLWKDSDTPTCQVKHLHLSCLNSNYSLQMIFEELKVATSQVSFYSRGVSFCTEYSLKHYFKRWRWRHIGQRTWSVSWWHSSRVWRRTRLHITR